MFFKICVYCNFVCYFFVLFLFCFFVSFFFQHFIQKHTKLWHTNLLKVSYCQISPPNNVWFLRILITFCNLKSNWASTFGNLTLFICSFVSLYSLFCKLRKLFLSVSCCCFICLLNLASMAWCVLFWKRQKITYMLLKIFQSSVLTVRADLFTFKMLKSE